MEKRISGKPLEISDKFKVNVADIYDYGFETFGYFQAELYWEKIWKAIETLPSWHLAYPECRHMATKSQMYRNIILDSHLIIFRVTKQRIEVLDIVDGRLSIKKIQETRKIRI